MRLESALFTSVQSIQAHGQAIGVLSDNISNSSTVGFKRSRAEFSDLLSQRDEEQFGGNTNSGSGGGVMVSGVRADHVGGVIENSGRELDVAIGGEGFFVVGTPDQQLYTRAGNFEIGGDGLLKAPSGQNVLGFAPGGAELGTIDTQTVNITGTPTTAATVSGNVSSLSDAVAELPAEGSTFAQIAAGSSLNAPISVFDSLGEEHSIQLSFFKTANNAWTARAYVDAEDVGGEAGIPQLLGETTLTFGANGALDEAAAAAAVITATPAWANGSEAGNFTIDVGSFSQNAGSNTIASIAQDGSGIGNIVGYTYDDNGGFFASLSSGSQVQIATIPLALFTSSDGLARVGDTLWKATEAAGTIDVAAANTAGRGVLAGSSLELSTVDLSREFTELVVIQQGYNGSSRAINLVQELLRNTTQLLG